MFDSQSFRLDGDVTLVTGGAAGIGFAIAETFASAGSAVMISDRDRGAAEAAAAKLVKTGGNVAAIECDVTKEEDLVRSIDATQSVFGGMTILVSNAGGGGPKAFDMSMEEFRRAFDLNLFSLFRLAQLAAPLIEESGGGAMLATTSMAGENSNERMASYASSKAAANHLIRNLAHDLGPMNIRINGIAPGAIRTHALNAVLTKEIEEAMLARTPLHRLGKPQDIANAALFLCSSASDWISGEILTVSGGGVQELA